MSYHFDPSWRLELEPEHNHDVPGSPRSMVWAGPDTEIRTRPIYEADWRRVLRTLREHWLLSIGFAVVVLAVAIIASFIIKPTYDSVAKIEVDPPGWDVVSNRDNAVPMPNTDDYVAIQVDVLKSTDLALDVIRKLGLDRNIDVVSKEAQTRAENAESKLGPRETQFTRLESVALATFQSRLKVSQSGWLINVSFVSHDPRLGAQVTNTLVNLFIDRHYRIRYEATRQASEWLSHQLDDLREKVEKSNKALVQFQNESGIADADDKQNPVSEKVAELNRQLSQAEADRIQLESYLRTAAAGSWESLPQIRDNLVLQTLTQKFDDARTRLALALTVYGKNNFKVKELQGEVDELQAQLAAEKVNLFRQLKTNYESAHAREYLLAKALNGMKGTVNIFNERLVQYTFLKKEAVVSEDLYNSLVARIKEAGIYAGLRSSNIHILESARILDRPTTPNRMLFIAASLVLGLLGALTLPFLKEAFDNFIRTPEDVRRWTMPSFVASIPWYNSTKNSLRSSKMLAVLRLTECTQTTSVPKFFVVEPRSPAAEAIRNLCSSVVLLRPERPPRVFLIASPLPAEGKTTVAVNLALALAEQGRTCLLDADMRKSAATQTFGLFSNRGVAQALMSSDSLDTLLLAVPNVHNLSLLPVGTEHSNLPGPGLYGAVSKLLGILRQRFDYLVIDSPPLVPFADARLWARLADGVILVGRRGSTTQQAMVMGTEILEQVHARLLGIVLNDVDTTSSYYRHYPS